jgi:hypothetical protein
MAKKKKNKIKSFLKKAAPLAALALGASALGRRGKGLGVSGADKALFTSDAAQMDNMMPDNISASMGPYKSYGARNPRRSGYNFAFKKGGRVGCGIAKKGFGRALKKGGK